MPVTNEGDLQVLAALRQHGSDLTKPAHTIHYLYFKSMDAAQAAAAELAAAGYTNIRTHKSPGQSLWKRLFGPPSFSCIAETHAIPEESKVFATTQWMNALAARHHGEYDGWEASIEQ